MLSCFFFLHPPQKSFEQQQSLSWLAENPDILRSLLLCNTSPTRPRFCVDFGSTQNIIPRLGDETLMRSHSSTGFEYHLPRLLSASGFEIKFYRFIVLHHWCMLKYSRGPYAYFNSDFFLSEDIGNIFVMVCFIMCSFWRWSWCSIVKAFKNLKEQDRF